jgi:hypothetical protein
MKIKTRPNEVSQTINLKEIFGVSFKKSRSLKLQVTQALIDKMKSRIATGLDRFGDEMAPYSKVYQESFDYIAARKDGTVNMKLTGDMLGSLDIVEDKGDLVTIGFRGSEENQKAYGHMMGEGRLPVRQFFGISDDEVESVKSDFSQELEILKEIGKTQATDNNITSGQTLEELRRAVEGENFGRIVQAVQDET